MKERVQVWFKEIFAKRDYKMLEDIVSPDYQDGPNHKGLTGPKYVQEKYLKLDNILTNITVELEDLIAEGNKVVAHYKMRATHSGVFLGIEATNRQFIQEGMTIIEFDSTGKINFTFGIYDRQKIIQQLT
ncbi:MAG: ester cyclase [Candidatus Heimdallarchaeota archaeon]|nr:ester cyclase [Candidatus Heimdallarchaeota archaeon]